MINFIANDTSKFYVRMTFGAKPRLVKHCYILGHYP